MATTLLVIVLHTSLTSVCFGANIALEKPAYQSGTFYGITTNKAVDGIRDRAKGTDYYRRVCAYPSSTQPKSEQYARWWVDLENTYIIHSVTVYNTFHMQGYKLMNSFSVDVVKADNITRHNCGVYNKLDSVGRGQSYTFHCGGVVGRFIYITKFNVSTSQWFMTLCEVEVDGVLPPEPDSDPNKKLYINRQLLVILFIITVVIIVILILHMRYEIKRDKYKRCKEYNWLYITSHAGLLKVIKSTVDTPITAGRVVVVHQPVEQTGVRSVIRVQGMVTRQRLYSYSEDCKPEPSVHSSVQNIDMVSDKKDEIVYDANVFVQKEDISDAEHDNISVSLLKGYGVVEKTYLRIQGVVPENVSGFWKMIWHYRANRIILFADPEEIDQKYCYQYWPEVIGQSELHDDITVTFESDIVCADYVTRTLTLTKGDVTRTIYQFHFTTWKDECKPTFGPVTVLHFHRRVRAMDSESTGPLVVHCGTGMRRTGTFIALDILLQQMKHDKYVDVNECMQKLEEQGMLLVESEDQHEFLHEAILESINVRNTAYSSAVLAEGLNYIRERDRNGRTEIDRQFELLCKLKDTSDDQDREGYLEINKYKNRDHKVVPADCDRPDLTTSYLGGNNYINAVYVDSFKKHGHYIVTQMPLPNTEADFWRLVYDHEVNFVIMLNEVDPSDTTCQQYWPDDGSKVYGPLNVRIMATANFTPNIILRKFVVSMPPNKNDEQQSVKLHKVRHYQLLGWPPDELLPPYGDDFLCLVEEVHKWQRLRPQPPEDDKGMGQMIVHCLNGVDHSGLFCAATHVIDQIKTNSEIDALLAARLVSRTRPQFLQSEEQYRALYDIGLEYLTKYPIHVGLY